MSLTDEERQALVTYKIEKAIKTLEQVKTIIPMGYWEMAANRLYYAAYYAVSALLLKDGFSVQTHQGIIHVFGQNYIKTNKIDGKFGTLYGRLFSLRQTGDYGDTFDLTAEDVTPLLSPTEELIKTISGFITNPNKR